MLIDSSLLRRARLENIERLAASLGVEAPRRKRDATYATQLVSAVASRIRRDAMMDELKRLTTLARPVSRPVRTTVRTLGTTL